MLIGQLIRWNKTNDFGVQPKRIISLTKELKLRIEC